MKMANMKRIDIRHMFPNHMVHFEEGVAVNLLDKDTGKCLASVVYAMHSGAYVWLYPGDKSGHQTIAHVRTYETEFDHTEAAQAERRQVGRKKLSDRTLKNEWNKLQERDFKDALEILRVFVHLLAGNTGGGCTREQFKQLTTYGRRLNNRLQRENNHTETAESYRTQLHQGAPVEPPVAQLTRLLAEDKARREDAPKRTVWDAEDDAIFELVLAEHKTLSNRVAELHAARGSKVAIPEWDRRKKEKCCD